MIALIQYILLIQLASSSSARFHSMQNQDADVLRWVDPLLGSRAGGNVFAVRRCHMGWRKVLPFLRHPDTSN
jgi:hypothetical protein